MTGVAIAVITDGRDDCLGQAMASIDAMVDGPIVERWMYDDTGDARHAERLAGLYPSWTIVSAGRRLGFGGAIGFVYSVLVEQSRADWILWHEDDFVATRTIPLDDMIALSEAQPHLAQVALRRQAWNPVEKLAGGFIEAAPAWYTERTEGGRTWVETVRNMTTNPSLFRRELCFMGWPTGADSEGRMGFRLREEGLPWGVPGSDVRFGFLGSMSDGAEWVHHIGHLRAGSGY